MSNTPLCNQCIFPPSLSHLLFEHDSTVMLKSTTISLVCSVTCTGCRFKTEYISDWLCLSSAVVTTWRLHNSPVTCTVLDWWCWGAATTSLQLSATTDYTANSTLHYWWPFILCDGTTNMNSLPAGVIATSSWTVWKTTENLLVR